jgi:hypothetical protein
MPILTAKQTWKRAPNQNSLKEKNRLLPVEEERVRCAMGALLIRYRSWVKVAVALKTDRTTVTRVLHIRKRATPAFALRVARLLGVPLGDVLSGAFPRPGQCPMCGATKH